MTEAEYRDELCTSLARIDTIINGLDSCEAFKMAQEDVKKQVDNIDQHWHLLPESEDWVHKIKEMRLAKMASEYIVKLIDNYRFEQDRIKQELFKLDNKDVTINKDYDSE